VPDPSSTAPDHEGQGNGSKAPGSDAAPPDPSTQDASGDGPASGRAGTAALTLGALGVVFGDIGTSPLYALDAVFASGAVAPDQTGVYGVISLVV